MRKLALVSWVMVMLAACGGAADEGRAGDTAKIPSSVPTSVAPPGLAEPVPLLVIAELGGCYMLGPNCATAVVMSDGSFEVFRNDPADVLAMPGEAAAAEFSGTIDVAPLARTMVATDFDVLRANLGPGECRACVDGIDYLVRFYTADGEEDLDSATHRFDTDLDLFAQLEAVREAVFAAGTLEVVPRGS
jgi:hypothetical protein